MLQFYLLKHEYSSNAILCNIYNFELDIYMSNSLQSEEHAWYMHVSGGFYVYVYYN